jgi:hypothetical protein
LSVGFSIAVIDVSGYLGIEENEGEDESRGWASTSRPFPFPFFALPRIPAGSDSD